MPSAAAPVPAPLHAARELGVLLREWRMARRLSQSDLAAGAGLSNRHMSYIENGRAAPSREALTRIAETLEMPLRERNALMMSAGYAPAWRETALDQPELERMRRAIDFILAQQEPYPAFVVNRRWDIVGANGAAARVNAFVMDGRANRHGNMILQFFDPEDLRPAVANWEDVAGDLLRHLHALVAAMPTDLAAKALLDQALRYPDVPAHWRRRDPAAAPSPMLTTVLQKGSDRLSFFSTITRFGTSWDVTLDELHIECCFPVDRETEELCARLAATDP